MLHSNSLESAQRACRRSKTRQRNWTSIDDGANLMASGLLTYIKSQKRENKETFRSIARHKNIPRSTLSDFHKKYEDMLKSDQAAMLKMDENGIVEHKSLVWWLTQQPSKGKGSQLLSDFMQECICLYIEKWTTSLLPSMGALFKTKFLDSLIREAIAMHDSEKLNKTVDPSEIDSMRVYTTRRSFLKKHSQRVRLNVNAKSSKARFIACTEDNIKKYFKNILETMFEPQADGTYAWKYANVLNYDETMAAGSSIVIQHGGKVVQAVDCGEDPTLQKKHHPIMAHGKEEAQRKGKNCWYNTCASGCTLPSCHVRIVYLKHLGSKQSLASFRKNKCTKHS